MRLPIFGLDHPIKPALIDGLDYREWGAKQDEKFLLYVDCSLIDWLRGNPIDRGDKGFVLNIVREFELWEAGGYRSFAALLKAKIDYSPTQVAIYGRRWGPKSRSRSLGMKRSIAHMGRDLKRIFSVPVQKPEDMYVEARDRDGVTVKLASLNGDWKQNLLTVTVELINRPVPNSKNRSKGHFVTEGALGYYE